MEILFAFKNKTNSDSFIFEIKYLNLPKDAPKSDKLKWFYYCYDKGLRNLKFSSMNEKLRNFECGMFLDIGNLKLKENQNSIEEDIEIINENDKEFIFKLLENLN